MAPSAAPARRSAALLCRHCRSLPTLAHTHHTRDSASWSNRLNTRRIRVPLPRRLRGVPLSLTRLTLLPELSVELLGGLLPLLFRSAFRLRPAPSIGYPANLFLRLGRLDVPGYIKHRGDGRWAEL